MLTSKQRSYLRGLAQTIDPSVYIGKNGITDNVIGEMDTCLYHQELIKVKIQESCQLDAKETANEMADRLGAEYVTALGRKFVLFRKSKDYPQIELPRK